MNGSVDEGGRALIQIEVAAAAQGRSTRLTGWIDTGFTGELVLPESMVTDLGLKKAGTVNAALGDGSTVLMDLYICFINWCGEQKQIVAAANSGQYPLIGVGLLQGKRLEVDYSSKTVEIE
ncbi:MAG: clan AA aspartic protease [Planctomycetota bacterium]|jgi:clan AA aspartic protease|nr:clan AA aspartic protease [Planctomycetota bacterium]MDP7249775.1 clan AA aspartic protease [Planctomycetota bacterium]